jgi:HNH endonuclease
MDLVSHERDQKLRAILVRMRTLQSTSRYYAVTLLASAEGRARWSAHSHFVGPSERRRGWEKRQASIVEPVKMIALWEGVGQSWLVVHDRAQLALWVRLGGNVLVEVGLAQEWLARMIAIREVAPDGPTGFLAAESLSDQQLARRPSRKVRMRIFERDEHMCRRCGRTADTVVLTRHHVLPRSAGGLTQENNLITLCDDRHNACHVDDRWYPAPDLHGILFADYYQRVDEDYNEAVQRHRLLIAGLLREPEGNAPD